MTPAAAPCQAQAWREHQREIRGFLARRLGSDADDLVQDVFVKALRQGEAFCALDNRRAWLFQVARNLLIDRLRRHRDELPLPDDLASAEAAVAGPLDALADCLPAVLARLPAEDRAAITACDLEGLTQKTYAAQTGLSLTAAKSRLQRARRRLHARLVTACRVAVDAGGRVCCLSAGAAPRPRID